MEKDACARPRRTSSSSAPSRPLAKLARERRDRRAGQDRADQARARRARVPAGTCSSRTCPARRRRCSPDRSRARSRVPRVAGPVHARHPADRRHRLVRLRPADARVRVPPRAGVRERPARRRDQPRDAEDAVGAARGDGRASGDGRRRHARAPGPVPAARDGEPDRAGGDVPAAGGAARPLLRSRSHSATRRSTRRSRSSAASARSIPLTRLRPVVDLDDVADAAARARGRLRLHRRAPASLDRRARRRHARRSRALRSAPRCAPASRSSGSHAPGRSSTVATT